MLSDNTLISPSKTNPMSNRRSLTNVSVLLASLILVVFMITSTSLSGMYVVAQSNSSSNMSSASVGNATSSTGPSDLDKKMLQLASSNQPKDIAALAYIWGYPLVSMVRLIDFSTAPNVPPGPSKGPINTFIHFRDFPNASFTDVVKMNVDTLYSWAYLNLTKEPLVLKVPPTSDRYYVLQFLDAYTNNFNYIGKRTNVTSGGTYLITGLGWNDKAPIGMTQIKSPTNDIIIAGRILAKDSQDVSNVRALQDKFVLSPLSVFEGKGTSINTAANASKEIPVSPEPSFIPITGVKIFDEIGKDMVGNHPYQYDADVIAKFKTIGIGPGKIPSETKNSTISKALELGIAEGEKLIDEKNKNLGTVINGWTYNLDTGDYGTDYLLRAAVAKYAFGANSPQEALYPSLAVDDKGQPLTGSNNYVIHFAKDKLPPVNEFWSITMYNSKNYLVENPINRNSIGDRTEGLKYNSDGSLDIYFQHASPGKDKESNWLPSPTDNFNLFLRLYGPQEVVLKGEYQIPPVQVVS